MAPRVVALAVAPAVPMLGRGRGGVAIVEACPDEVAAPEAEEPGRDGDGQR